MLSRIFTRLLEYLRGGKEPVTLQIGAVVREPPIHRPSTLRLAPVPLSSRRHPRNVEGNYWVEAECCTLCGIPSHLAPDLFDEDDTGCWVKRQPVTADERARMVAVMDAQELGCICSSDGTES